MAKSKPSMTKGPKGGSLVKGGKASGMIASPAQALCKKGK